MLKTFLKFAVAAAFVVAVEFLYGWGNVLTHAEEFAKNNANPFAFLAIMSIGCAVGLPMSFCTLFAGAAFGAWLGGALSVAGISVSASLGYLIGKFFIPAEQMEKIKQRFNISATQKAMFDLNFYVRAVPGIPYCIQNFILGAADSQFKMYMLLGVSIQGAIAVAMCALGSSISEEGYTKYAAIAVLVVVIVAIRFLFKRFFNLH